MSTLDLKKKERQTGQQFTYQMNENKKSRGKGGGGILIVELLQNDDPHVQSVAE